MSTSVVRGCLETVLSQVVGTDGLDVYAMMNGNDIGAYVPHLCHCGITDAVVRSTFTFDSEEEVVKMCQGSGRVRNASRRVAGQCVRGAIGVGRQGKICPSLLKGKGMGKGTLQWDTWSKTATKRLGLSSQKQTRRGCL